MQPPALEQELGLATYLTTTPGIGGRLRTEAEDFRVTELGPGPKPGEGPFTAAFVELRNWETNRFAGQAARRIGIKPGAVAFAGMKDKRAVTKQWFTFKCAPERLAALDELQDVKVHEIRPVGRATYAGAHEGNRFELRIRDHQGDAATLDACLDQIRAAGGVPQFFGPQRFGSAVRPITHKMGAALVAGDLEEAVRLFCGHPMPAERAESAAARKVYEETRDPQATLDVLPAQLDLERSILQRLARRPGEWRNALAALPHNLLTLFVHAHQSWVFNHVVSARLAAGMPLGEAQLGDRVMAHDDDGTKTHLVTAANRDRVQAELDEGRAVLTAPLPGLDAPHAEGEPGAIEAAVLERLAIDESAFNCKEFPQVASHGRRRGILQPVTGLAASWVDGDPVVAFDLGKGAYATVVLREIMKADTREY